MDIRISLNGAALAVVSPYNVDFVEAAKNLGGKWRDGQWVFDSRNEAAVRRACVAAYGTDGHSAADLVSLRITFDRDAEQHCGPITINGRSLVRASGRDSGARLCDGVVLESGHIRSGGSVKNWQTIATEGTTLLVHDVPRAHAESVVREQYLGSEHSVTAEIVEIAPVTIDKDALRGERERLVARLAEIDALLNQEVQ